MKDSKKRKGGMKPSKSNRNYLPSHANGLMKHNEAVEGESAHKDNPSLTTRGKKKFKWKKTSRIPIAFPPFIIYTALSVIAVSIVTYISCYSETLIDTPFSDQKVVAKSGLEVQNRYWGSYRSGIYFGMRTREEKSLLAGLMWFTPRLWAMGDVSLRHDCEQGDKLDTYGWLEHDGRNFGVQDIQDKLVRIRTSFVKRQGGVNGGDWSAKISVQPRSTESRDELVSVMFYFTFDEETDGILSPILDGSGERIASIIGFTSSLGEFQVHFRNSSNVILNSYLSTYVSSPHTVKDATMQGLKVVKKNGQQHLLLSGKHFSRKDLDKLPNLIVYNAIGKAPFEVQVIFESASNNDRVNRLSEDLYDLELERHRKNFTEKFEKTFGLAKRGYKMKDIFFAKAAMSNMIGGIGYFYGSSRVQSSTAKEPVSNWPAPLYTAVPSRSFFPRGFLWDEGFHNLLISKWDKEISQDIIAHWLDLMNKGGWIPREQILGIEARVRVPEEFVVQKDSSANPPTLLLSLHGMFGEAETISKSDLEYLRRAWPRLVAWYSWLNTTQVGKEASTYYWRGRDATAMHELNPKSLSSGLDDYPRASHPNDDERHLDLRCWMTLASKLMGHIAKLIGKDGQKYIETWQYLANNELLDRVHLSTKAQVFSDYGLHSKRVRLKRPKSQPGQPKPQMVKEVVIPPSLGYVDDTFGYVSLFPLFTHILDPNSSRLGKLLEDVRSTDLLWTKYGLRSLSRSSTLYDKRNTEHDPPYWRGAIWINMNYLAVKSLHHYSMIEGFHRERAKALLNELRDNVITNVIKEYYRTGYLWEQYSDKTGEGMGCHPFTGWSSLVVLMMAENC